MDNVELFCEVAKLAGKYDFTDELMWKEELDVSVNVSDLFFWGCADAEEVTEENLPVLRQAIEDLAAVSPRSVSSYAGPLFAARVRDLRPQGKYISDYVHQYPDRVKVYSEEFQRDVWETPRGEDGKIHYDPALTAALKALFLALPERPVDLGNPYTPGGSYDYRAEAT